MNILHRGGETEFSTNRPALRSHQLTNDVYSLNRVLPVLHQMIDVMDTDPMVLRMSKSQLQMVYLTYGDIIECDSATYKICNEKIAPSIYVVWVEKLNMEQN